MVGVSVLPCSDESGFCSLKIAEAKINKIVSVLQYSVVNVRFCPS